MVIDLINSTPSITDQFKRIINCCKKVGYNMDFIQLSTCIVINPIMMYSYSFLFNCTMVGQALDPVTTLT